MLSTLRRLVLGMAAIAPMLGAGCSDREPTPEAHPVQQQAAHPGDPHVFECAACHTPRTRAQAANWRTTCTRSGCHPQAWTLTIFHRVEPDVFSDCKRCHVPHTWVANGEDCMSCHAGIYGAEGVVAAASLQGTPMFPHDRHRRLGCNTCHALSTRHADLKIGSPQQCTACHHGPPAAASCTSCHATVELAGARTRVARVQLQVWPVPRDRSLPFDHARHERYECERCHTPSTTWAPADNCTSCHAEHHRPEASCITCHTRVDTPAHTLDVHTGSCRECHGGTSAAHMQMTRNFCLVCHQDKVEHMAGGNCADCHKLTPSTEDPVP